MNALHPKVITILASLAVATEMAPLPTADTIGRLTLDGALICAVGVLWRALTRKDDQVVEMARKVTETMALVTTAVTELRSTVASLKVAYEDLPCAIRESQNASIARQGR